MRGQLYLEVGECIKDNVIEVRSLDLAMVDKFYGHILINTTVYVCRTQYLSNRMSVKVQKNGFLMEESVHILLLVFQS